MGKIKILVTGAGGFIGGHLIKTLISGGCDNIKAIDVKPFDQWYQFSPEAENIVSDLSIKENCTKAVFNVDEVYNLACNMGGIGFIESHKSDCMFSTLINTHLLQASIQQNVSRYFLSSTACIYNREKQSSFNVIALKEEDAYPAFPEDGYGWEKLFAEQLCLTVAREHPIQVRIARLHNVYGPCGTWDGGREKAPAAICRKISMVKLGKMDSIEIWGNGNQIRSFMYIEDCIEGINKIMRSDVVEPINLGSSEAVSINQLVEIIENIVGVVAIKTYKASASLGVVGRNCDNTKIKKHLYWEPSIQLSAGLKSTYEWVYEQCKNQF